MIKKMEMVFFMKKEKKKYEGEWKNDLYDGKGIIYFDKNDWVEAIFKNGKCKKILNNSPVKNRKCIRGEFWSWFI